MLVKLLTLKDMLKVLEGWGVELRPLTSSSMPMGSNFRCGTETQLEILKVDSERM